MEFRSSESKSQPQSNDGDSMSTGNSTSRPRGISESVSVTPTVRRLRGEVTTSLYELDEKDTSSVRLIDRPSSNRQISVQPSVLSESATDDHDQKAKCRQRTFSTTMQSEFVNSNPRINIICESPCILPSISSIFSLTIRKNESFESASPLRAKENQPTFTSSCQSKLHVLEDDDYVDTVKSTDSSASALKRSVSAPPIRTYELESKPNVFEDFIVNRRTRRDELKWRQNMYDLIEQPEYMDTLMSQASNTVLLAREARRIAQENQLAELENGVPGYSHRHFTKNLLVLSVGFTFVFVSYLSLRNLMSSMYSKDGLALMSFASLYAMFFIGCTLATTVVQYLRAKRTIILAHVMAVFFNVANFYPNIFTLVPSSALLGATLGMMWTGQATYLANIALLDSQISDASLQSTIARYNGIFFMIFQSSNVIGGLISSAILSLGTLSPYSAINVTNVTAAPRSCGLSSCQVELPAAGSLYSDASVYSLVGIFLVFSLTGVLIIGLFLDPLEGAMKSAHSSVLHQLLAVFKWFIDWKVVCLLPLMFYTAIQMAFMFGEFSKIFISCPFGTAKVGYGMICLSTAGGTSAFVSGKLVKYSGISSIILFGGLLQISLLLGMRYYVPDESNMHVLFIFCALWGIGDGIWLTHIVSVVGVLFADNKEAAFAGLKMCQSLGSCLVFVTSRFLCSVTKVYILLGVLSLAMFGYLCLIIVMRVTQTTTNRNPKPVKV